MVNNDNVIHTRARHYADKHSCCDGLSHLKCMVFKSKGNFFRNCKKVGNKDFEWRREKSIEQKRYLQWGLNLGLLRCLPD